jgi:hypothetical protein
MVSTSATPISTYRGHDEEKNALRLALAYDPEAEAWTEVPKAAKRDEPRGLCAGGRSVCEDGSGGWNSREGRKKSKRFFH